jgi:hypothetical protein
VYPEDGSKPYLNCKILEITEGNTVSFEQGKKSYSLKAISIKKDGIYVDLSEYVQKELVPVNEHLQPHIEEEFTIDTIERKQNAHSFVAIGAGSSFGGMGPQFQLGFLKTKVLAIHVSMGVTPDMHGKSGIYHGYKIGVKAYAYKPFYFDLAYGLIGFTNWSAIKGFSLMTGADVILYKKLGLNIGVGMGYTDQTIYVPLADFGIFFNLPALQ